MCWMAPGPVMSATVKVSPAGMRTKGFTFQPLPRSRAAALALPSSSSHMAPAPLAPLRFSGLMDRETAFDSRNRLLILFIMPLYIFQKSPFICDIGFIFLDRIIVEEICSVNIFL